MGTASGRYVETIVGGERVRAFVPDPLPPMGLDLGPLLVPLSRAERAIGRSWPSSRAWQRNSCV